MGYTSDPKAEEHAVQFDEDGKVTRGYRGKGWDGQGDAEGPGDIVKGLSGEAVRIMKRPGEPLQSMGFQNSTHRDFCSCRPQGSGARSEETV